jgi:hypothetical protein
VRGLIESNESVSLSAILGPSSKRKRTSLRECDMWWDFPEIEPLGGFSGPGCTQVFSQSRAWVSVGVFSAPVFVRDVMPRIAVVQPLEISFRDFLHWKRLDSNTGARSLGNQFIKDAL